MLRRPIRQTQKSGVYVKAVVEDISLGYATVRLARNGARMTRLPVLGGAVSVGETVVVDYSAGVPPMVRPITTPYPEEEVSLGDSFGEGMNEVQSDVSFKVYGTVESTIGTSFAPVTWNASEFQTEPFFSTGNPSVLTLPFDGFYFITAQVAVSGFKDWRSIIAGALWSTGEWAVRDFKRKTAMQRVEGELRGSEAGVFGFNIGDTMDMEPLVVTTLEVHGMMSGVEGEEITLHLKHTDPDRDTIDLKVDDANHLYPRIWGFRMTRGGFHDAGGSSYGSTPGSSDPDDPTGGGGSGQDDDSDIEIRTNMGYLHVSDETGQTYARGIAYVGDWPSLEILLDYRFEDTDNGAILRVFLRSTRDWDDWETPTRGYELSLNNTGGYGLHRVEGGSRTLIGSINGSGSILDHKLRFQASGTNIKAKTWLASESEPGWALEIADSGGFTDSGGLQLGYFNSTGDHKIYIDNLDLHVP
jgi:hypothetical protein